MSISKELLDKTSTIVTDWANDAVKQMRKLLRERSKSGDDSMLAQSINFNGTKITSDGVQLVWDIDDYYIYIDLGVKGYNNTSKTRVGPEKPSGFKFKNASTPKQMINSLKDYISRNGIPLDVHEGQTTLEALEAKAYSMAKAIKRKGINATGFYSDVFNQKNFDSLADKLSTVLGEAISVKIVSSFQDIKV